MKVINHLFSKVYEEILVGHRELRIPAVVKSVSTVVRGDGENKWRLINIYVLHPKLGVIERNAKLVESYYMNCPNDFMVGSNIEVRVAKEGADKGVGYAMIIGDDYGITYDWVFLSQKESGEAEYIQKFKPKCLFKLAQAFLDNPQLNSQQNEYSIEQGELLKIYKETVSNEYEGAKGLNVSCWFTDSEAEEESWQYEKFLNSTASKWNFKQFRKNVRSLMVYENFNVPIEAVVNIQDDIIFYDASELPEQIPYSRDTSINDYNFYEVDDYYNDQLDLDQQDPEFYNNL